MLASSRRRAARKGVKFSITERDIEIPKVCPLLGLTLKKGTKKGGHDCSPSLDRIDNGLGYVPGNVWVISKLANSIKHTASI
jgi:hypothetical protein